MIKELLLAIILGALLGLGVTGGFFVIQKNKTNSVTATVTPTLSDTISNSNDSITPTITTTKDEASKDLIISSPQDNSVASKSKISIEGQTKPNSIIVITTLSKTYNSTSDENGEFSSSIELDGGINQIKITAIDENDNQSESNLSVTYSTAKI